MDETKRCVACRMDIRAEATRCPHCRERQPGAEPMHRGGPERMVGGVCTALARRLGLDVALVRVAFVLALVVTGGTALGVYLLLWVLTPPSALGKAPVQRMMGWVGRVASAPVEEPRVERKV
ncbi:PspC domain-containing protein [Archangium sp.]|uniref:PspC domain-containing protein n=1 Tax=Archangium sp. TaxID=1872627 RepID=UPI002D53C26D|nr:PspC domain-containing protein [Archangium sp.]HYO56575.1 PspC domain-containing protein [Archangium sp.]